MARTMSDERERELRTVYVEGPYEDKTSHAETWAELDAERDAHEETNALLKAEIKAHAKTQERLALAEAVCEAASIVSVMQPLPFSIIDALAAWRAGK